MAKMGSSGRVNVSVLLVCLLSMTGLVLELKWGSLSTYAFANVTLNPRGLESVATSDASRDAISSTASNAWQPQSGAVGCPGKSKKLSADLFKSQYGEDKVLLEYFGKLCNGTYLEMGALNGVHLSNSHVFHKGLGWKGMLLEASPKNYKELQENRPNELALVHAGICSSQSQLHWVEGKWSPTGGFLEFASQEHQQKFFTPQAIRDAKPVTCSPLGQIIQERLGNQVFFDFYSLDIEGAELQALETIDFTQVSFGIIMVEASGFNKMKDQAVRSLLDENGYTYAPQLAAGLKGDIGSDFFINKRWKHIYKDLIYS